MECPRVRQVVRLMNNEQNKLFDLINKNGYDLEDLIETIRDDEVKRLNEVWEEEVKQD